MKKLLLSSAVLATALQVNAQCTDLIISEYVEGSGNDKAIEFYNPTASPINLAAGGYVIQRWSNGANEASGGSTNLTGVIQPYETHVLVNGQTTVENGGTSPAVTPALQAMADQLDHAYPAPTYMNGNDALVLLKNNGTVVVDVFGKPGEDPGDAWTDDASAGYTNANGGTWWTKNQTLIRKPNVKSGVTTIPAFFNPTAEYDSLPKDTWSMLGFHNCECDPNFNNSIEEIQKPVSISMFPNPNNTGQLFIRASEKMDNVAVYNLAGSLVFEQTLNEQSFMLRTDDWNKGLYFVEIKTINNRVQTQKLIVK